MNKEDLVNTLKLQLQKVKKERIDSKQNPVLLASIKSLKDYQTQRLIETHEKLLSNSDTRYAALFFLNEIYGSKDFSARDNDIEKLIPMMQKMFPFNTLETITQAIVLDCLSEQLDNKMAKKLGVVFTKDNYENFFVEISSKEERLNQINMVESLGYSLCKLVKIPLLQTTLKMMRVPAKIAGLYNLHNFLENGFNVFKSTKNPEKFIFDLINQEKILLNELYNKDNYEKSN